MDVKFTWGCPIQDVIPMSGFFSNMMIRGWYSAPSIIIRGWRQPPQASFHLPGGGNEGSYARLDLKCGGYCFIFVNEVDIGNKLSSKGSGSFFNEVGIKNGLSSWVLWFMF